MAHGSHYVGVSDNPQRRLDEHNQGKGSDWTAERRPVRLVWTEAHPTLSSARQRENQLKRWSHSKKTKLIEGPHRRFQCVNHSIRIALFQDLWPVSRDFDDHNPPAM